LRWWGDGIKEWPERVLGAGGQIVGVRGWRRWLTFAEGGDIDSQSDDNRSRRFRPSDRAGKVQSPFAVQPGFAEFSGGQVAADAKCD